MQEKRRSRYMTINRALKRVEDKSKLARKIFAILIAVFLVIALIVSVVIVIIYSPTVSSGDNTKPSTNTTEASLLSRIEQLEVMQGTNNSFKSLQESLESLKAQVQQNLSSIESLKAQFQQNLSSIESLVQTMQQTTNHSFVSLQESLESLEAQVQQQFDYNSSQFLNVQNSVQNLSLVQNNIRQDLDRLLTMQGTTNHSFVSLQESLESLEAQVQQQFDYNSSQILNSVQNLSLVQNIVRQDLDILRNSRLYDGCFQETRSCTLSTNPITAIGGCSTGTVNIVSLSPYTL